MDLGNVGTVPPALHTATQNFLTGSTHPAHVPDEQLLS